MPGLTGGNWVQAHLISVHPTSLCFTDVTAFFFYKLQVRPSTSKKITTCFTAAVWKGTPIPPGDVCLLLLPPGTQTRGGPGA